MGCYINPTTTTKESWLGSVGREVGPAPTWESIPANALPVCLVDNGLFTAAAVCYKASELEEFARPDGRPRRWFLVDRTDLRTVSPLADFESHRTS